MLRVLVQRAQRFDQLRLVVHSIWEIHTQSQ